MIRVLVDAAAFDPATELTAFDDSRHGAVASFVGRVRGDDGVATLMLDHHPRMAPAILTQLAEAAVARFTLSAAAIRHRVGTMAVGDAIVFVAAGAPHRAAALDAVAFMIDRLKTDAPFWKQESLVSGVSRWVAARQVDAVRADAWRDPAAP